MQNQIESVELDRIIEPPNLIDCDFVNCIYQKLFDYNSEYICNTLGELYETQDRIVTIRYDNRTVITDEPLLGDGQTEYLNDTIHITIDSDSYPCNSDNNHYNVFPEVELASTILHELSHAIWFHELADANLDPYSVSDYKLLWPDYIDFLYEIYGNDVNSVHHYVMVHLENVVNQIAVELNEMIGNEYATNDDFMCVALQGLEFVMSDEILEEMRARNCPDGAYNALEGKVNDLGCW